MSDHDVVTFIVDYKKLLAIEEVTSFDGIFFFFFKKKG